MWLSLRRIIVPVLVAMSTLGCQPTMSDLQAQNPGAATLLVPCRPGAIPDSVDLMAVQSGTGHIVTNENPDELMSVAPSASVFIEFNEDAPDENADVMASRYGLSCPNDMRRSVRDAQNAARPDPRFLGQTTGNTGAATSSTSLRRIPVCARPPGITSNEWLGGVPGIKGAKTTSDKTAYAKHEAEASVVFYYDANAPPESIWNFGENTTVRCPGKAPMPFKDYGAAQNAKASGGGGGTGNGSTTTATTNKAPSNSSGKGTGPKLETWEKFLQDFVIGTEILSGDVSGTLDHPEGSRHGAPAGKNVGAFSFPPLQAGYALVKILSTVGMTPKSFVDNVIELAKNGQRSVIKEADEKLLKMADELIATHGRYEMAKGLETMGVIMPYSLGQKFTAGLGAKFQAHKIFEKRAFKEIGIEGVEKAPCVILTDAEHKQVSAALDAAWTAAKAKSTDKLTKAELRAIYEKVYKDYPHWLKAIETYLQ